VISVQEMERRIQNEIIPGQTRILKAQGRERRLVISNKDREIRMKTGVKTNASKKITYDMVAFALKTISKRGCFKSEDFRAQFREEYCNGPCKFTMTGGVLVKLGIANREPGKKRGTCYYTPSGK